MTPGFPRDVAVSGNYAYVANGEAGLRVIEYYGAGVEESPMPQAASAKLEPTVVRGVLNLGSGLGHNPNSPSGIGLCPKPCLLDAAGRKVMDLKPGANDVRHLAAGIYFVRAVSCELSAVSCQKVVIQR